MKFLIFLLSEDGSPEGASTMRFCTLLTCGLVLGTWTYVSVMKKELQPLSPEQAGIVMGMAGVKAWQRMKEETPQPKPTTEPPK